MTQIDLTGKTAIVTGAAQGLGRAIVEQLHAAGANVVVNYAQLSGEDQNRQKAEELVSLLGDRAIAIAADVRDQAGVEKMFDQTETLWSKVDMVVNNAGITRDAVAKKMTTEQWQQVIDTNLNGTFNVCQQASQRMADNGRIVNVSSLSAFLGTFGQVNYAASKAGVAALTKVLSRELVSVRERWPAEVETNTGSAI